MEDCKVRNGSLCVIGKMKKGYEYEVKSININIKPIIDMGDIIEGFMCVCGLLLLWMRMMH